MLSYLTLTSVVFEYSTYDYDPYADLDLTLTSVVFELEVYYTIGRVIEFNFNKCCIWILVYCYRNSTLPLI